MSAWETVNQNSVINRIRTYWRNKGYNVASLEGTRMLKLFLYLHRWETIKFLALPTIFYLLDNSANTEAGLLLIASVKTEYMDLNYYGGREPKQLHIRMVNIYLLELGNQQLFISSVWFWQVGFSLLEIGFHFIVKDSLKFVVLATLAPEGSNYRYKKLGYHSTLVCMLSTERIQKKQVERNVEARDYFRLRRLTISR